MSFHSPFLYSKGSNFLYCSRWHHFLIFLFILLWMQTEFSHAQNQQLTLAFGDFYGAGLKDPSFAKAMSQSIADTLAMHPSIKIVSRKLLKETMKQNQVNQIYSANSGAFAQALESQAMITGEIMQSGDAIITRIRMYEAGTGRPLGSRSIHGSTKDLGKIPVQASEMITQFFGLPPHPFSSGASGIATLINFGNGLDLGDQGKFVQAGQAFLEASNIEKDFQISNRWQKEMSQVGLTSVDDPLERARLYRLQGNMAEAIKELEKAKASGSYGVPARILRAEVLLDQGNNSVASQELQSLINSGTKDPQLFFNMGRVMRATGKLKQGIVAFEQAVKLNPNHLESIVQLGELYQIQGDFNKAGEFFMRAGDLSFDKFNYHGALIFYRRAKSMLPNDNDVLSREGKTLFELGSLDVAMKLLEEAQIKNPNNLEAKVFLGQIYFLKGNKKEAVELLMKGYESNPQDFYINYYLGLYYLQDPKEESQKKGLEFLQKSVAVRDNHKGALLALARQYRNLGMISQSRLTYEQLFRLDKDNFQLSTEMGEFFRETGDFTNSELLYTQAIRLNPDLIEAHEGLGDLYGEQGNKEKAEAQFAILKKIDSAAQYRTSILVKHLIQLVKTMPTFVKTEIDTKTIQTVSFLGISWKRPENIWERIYPYIRFRKPNKQKFIAGLENALETRYMIRSYDSVGEDARSLGFKGVEFKSPAIRHQLMVSANLQLGSDASALLQLKEIPIEKDLEKVKFEITLYMVENFNQGHFGNTITVTLPRKGFYKVNYAFFITLATFTLLTIIIVFREIHIGRGNAKVVIKYDKKQAAGYFSLKLSRKEHDSWAQKVGKGTKKFSKKASFWSPNAEYMVGDVTLFKRFRCGKYFVHLFGNIAERDNRDNIIGTFSIAKPVTIKKKKESIVEFNLIQEEAYLEVIVKFQEQVLVGAQVVCKETGDVSGTKKEEGASFHLKPGSYHFTASFKDLRNTIFYKLEGLESKEICIVLNEANRLAEQGQFEAAAEIYLQSGDETEAARMYERAGQLAKACQILGEKFLRDDNYEKALECYERAEDFDNMASIYQRMGDQEMAYRCFGLTFLKKKQYDDAIRMFTEGKNYDLLAKAYEGKGDARLQYQSLGRFHQQKGEDLEAAGAFEKGEDFAEAAEAYIRVQNVIKAAEMFGKAGKFERAAEMFLKGQDKKRAAMAYEKAGLAEKAASLYEDLGDTTRTPQVLMDGGKYLEAGKAFRASGLLDEALTALRKVEVKDPGFIEACDLMATIFEEKGEIGLAVQAAQRGLSHVVIDSANLDRFYSLGKRQEAAGEMTDAIRTFEKILAVNLDYKDLGHHVRELKENMQAKTMMGTSDLLQKGGQSGGIPAANSTRYELVKEIGRGGMGIVYQAKDKLLERTVAYKLLPDHIKDNPKALQAFLKEAKAAARLSHPNLVMVFDTGQENGNYFITMEFVEGQTLKQLFNRTPKQLRPQDVLFVGLMVCDGLNYAHKNRIIHRDIKPSNIMVNRDRQVKIMDFGLATVLQSAALEKTMMRGTPLYMAPEMIMGRNVDYRSDIYSMGITLYEMTTKHLPFSTGDIAYHHLHTPPPHPQQFNPAVPPQLSAIILKAISKKQEDRYQTMEELIADLKQCQMTLQNNQGSQVAPTGT